MTFRSKYGAADIEKKLGDKVHGALYLISKALRWGKEDNIICSPISFVSASNAALINGAKPHFCEINYETGNICTKSIEKKNNKIKKKEKKNYSYYSRRLWWSASRLERN